MSIKYYQSAFESDIFYQKKLNNPIPQQKFIFNYNLRPKDKVSSLSSYMEKEQPPKESYHIKVFTSKATDVLNTSKKYIPPAPREYSSIHHLSKSQIHLGDDDMSSYNIKKHPKPKSVDKYPKEESAFHRKLTEFYGRDYSQKYATLSTNHSSHNLMKNEIYFNDVVPSSNKHNRSFSSIYISTNNNHNSVPIKQIKVKTVKHNKSQSNLSQFSNRVDFLKSNIFNDPNKAIINASHTITHKETELDAYPLPSKRKYRGSINRSFDEGYSQNIMSEYKKQKPKLTAKERMLGELYCSFDTIPIIYTKNNSIKQFYDTKDDLECQAIRHLKGKKEASVKKQLENISSLNGSEFYTKSYHLNSHLNGKEEIIHKYEINNIKDQDVKQIKQCFTNNGIHLYDTTLQDNTINADVPQKITVKIRENVNDENFHCNLIKAQNKLKNEKGLEMKREDRPVRGLNNYNNTEIIQSRKESKGILFKKLNNKNNMKKKESITSIPFDVKYKNDFWKR